MAQAELGDQEAIINSEDNEHQDDYEVHWQEDDPANPHAMTSKRKWIIVSLVSTMTVCVCVTSSLYTATYNQIMAEFNCSRTVATLGLSFYIAGLGWGPLVMSPLSEFYGRRPIYLVSLPLYIVFLIPCAAAHNIQTMLVARFLDGLAGAAFTSVAGATVGDMYTKSTLHTPMLLYTASPLYGIRCLWYRFATNGLQYRGQHRTYSGRADKFVGLMVGRKFPLGPGKSQ
ncbi:MFS transporter [Aspergillus luchuensis]|uniref:MFS transporter n=1 Tax=Aspergillus kawachii TaxID=1069201 RepID=A0A146F523_ASPKA|nr:MFS transporter [Aspergillus luchuensis]